MQSKLDPNNLSIQQNAPVQPISPAILTPLGWLDTFLTPGTGGSGNQNIVFPPFVVFEPTATPAVTASPPPTVATTLPSPNHSCHHSCDYFANCGCNAVCHSARQKPTDPTDIHTPDTDRPHPRRPHPRRNDPPTPIPTGYPSTPPAGYTSVTPPIQIGTTVPDGIPANISAHGYIYCHKYKWSPYNCFKHSGCLL